MLTHGDDDNADRRNLCQHEWIVCNRVKYNTGLRTCSKYAIDIREHLCYNIIDPKIKIRSNYNV